MKKVVAGIDIVCAAMITSLIGDLIQRVGHCTLFWYEWLPIGFIVFDIKRIATHALQLVSNLEEDE